MRAVGGKNLVVLSRFNQCRWLAIAEVRLHGRPSGKFVQQQAHRSICRTSLAVQNVHFIDLRRSVRVAATSLSPQRKLSSNFSSQKDESRSSFLGSMIEDGFASIYRRWV